MSIRDEDALEYHSTPPAGKLSTTPTKPCLTERDLSLAYTPGVAAPCMAIHHHPAEVYKYTNKGNLVAVVSNGSAVLGLGDIGAAAGKPVMEGKAVLFKRFAGIDVFDIELATDDPKEIIRACQLLEPTFGGINLEDIKAPGCFEVEQELKRTLKIPVIHDDQHGTAIISGAALLNAVEVAGKKLEDVRLVVNGAGAGGLACARHYISLGIRRENVLVCDSKGVIHEGRTEGMNPYKMEFARQTGARSLADAMKGADVFLGLSVADCVTPEMLLSMADNPIVFAMANPDPEIRYELAVETRDDVIMATGRSDFPNQVNNVLGFPSIFRGALDVRATAINEEMKLAATKALAALAKEDVPDSVRRAYGGEEMTFGRHYIVPKPFDSRVLIWVASAIAQAAMDSGVALEPIDIEEYRDQLARRIGGAQEVMRIMIRKAQRQPKRVVFPEGEEDKILRACQILVDEKIAEPILIGDKNVIDLKAKALRLNLNGVRIINPGEFNRLEEYIQTYFNLRQRKGATRRFSEEAMENPMVLGSMMLRMGDADALIGGLRMNYPDALRPALQVIPPRGGLKIVCGMYVVLTSSGQRYFLADTTVNIDPTAEDLAEIAIITARTVQDFDETPRVAMLSFSNFGSVRHPKAEKVRQAVEILRERAPELIVDGEMQADTAVVEKILKSRYPFSSLTGPANVLIFPDLESGNIAYKLLQRIGGAEAIGPILMGLSKPVHVLQRDDEVSDIVNMTAVAVVDAQEAGSIPSKSLQLA